MKLLVIILTVFLLWFTSVYSCSCFPSNLNDIIENSSNVVFVLIKKADVIDIESNNGHCINTYKSITTNIKNNTQSNNNRYCKVNTNYQFDTLSILKWTWSIWIDNVSKKITNYYWLCPWPEILKEWVTYLVFDNNFYTNLCDSKWAFQLSKDRFQSIYSWFKYSSDGQDSSSWNKDKIENTSLIDKNYLSTWIQLLIIFIVFLLYIIIKRKNKIIKNDSSITWNDQLNNK